MHYITVFLERGRKGFADLEVRLTDLQPHYGDIPIEVGADGETVTLRAKVKDFDTELEEGRKYKVRVKMNVLRPEESCRRRVHFEVVSSEEVSKEAKNEQTNGREFLK